MDHRAEVRDFLTSRRARLSPEQAGLPTFGASRRVKGLRREEVATLAGVSVDYYNRMERGNLGGVSDSVLDALANALQLDQAERIHLSDLARMANASGRQRQATPRPRVRPTIQRLMDRMADVPVYVRNGQFDVLAANNLARALLADLFDPTDTTPNLARYLFLDERSRAFYADWESVARDCVAALRIEAGRNAFDRGLTGLVGELSTRSEPFRQWWATHNVRLHTSATKLMRHALVGDIEVTGEALAVIADEGLTMVTYTVEPASTSSDALQLLASWSATQPDASPPDFRGHSGRDLSAFE